jgi:hypothetical protein
MIARLLLAGLAAAAALAPLAAPAAAAPGDREFKSVGDKEVVTLDPAKSYMIVQTNSDAAMFSFPLAFVRIPDEADVADYRARRQAALDKAHSKWVKKHAQWKAEFRDWFRLSDSDKARLPRPVQPVEPNDSNLKFQPLDLENMFQVGPFNRFSKKNDRSVFVTAVPPGRYAFYGPVNILQPAGVGTCMCMGTIQFEIKPGEIVNAGMMEINLMSERERAKKEGRETPDNDMELPETMNSISWAPPRAGDQIDPRLASFRIVPAELRAAGRFPNYYGVHIDRLTAIPGILDYDRDRVVDVKAGGAVVR